MKAIRPTIKFFLLITTLVLLSCEKVKSGVENNSSTADASYYVHFKRVNNYNPGSKIIVQRVGYHGTDTRYATTNVFLEKTLPFVDTTFWNISYATNYTLYFKWKILAANNDSLNGGITPTAVLLPDGSADFYINY